MSDEDDDRGFQVRDRRRFNESGEARDEGDEVKAPSEDLAPKPDLEAPGGGPVLGEELPPITFSAFLMSISSQALLCLGELPDPSGSESPEDLPAARELIDILGMLKEKTRGNLDATESGLLDGVLYDLRMRYVGKVRG